MIGAVRSALGGGRFTPRKLFAAGEVGAWYDPSDLSTMFQDRAGTTPVTADGQTVGLMLDKSKGLVLGSEKIINGSFNTDLASWTNNTGATWNSGTILLSATSANATISQSFTTVVGMSYRITFDYISGNIVNSIIRVGTSAGDASNLNLGMNAVGTGAGKITLFVATATTSWITLFVNYPAVSITGVWDNISVKELPGNHAVAPSDAARPLYKTDGTYHWLQFDGVDDSLSTAAINFTSTDKMSVFGGNYFSNNTGNQSVFSLSSNPDGTVGTFRYDRNVATSRLQLGNVGARLLSSYSLSGPVKSVSAQSYRFDSGGSISLRNNGASVALTPVVADTITAIMFSTNSLFIGGVTSAFHNGNIYSLIIRGALSTTQEITDTETWVNGKTGAY